MKILDSHFHNIGIRATIQSDGEIRLSSYCAQDFLNYIGSCPVDCYKYKWNLGSEEEK